MERLNNPFVIYGYKGAEYFCDRQKETETIMRAMHNERNVALISPRRIGKTGLIHHAFAQITNEHPDIRCFYMDINATRNLQQFVELFAKTVIGKLDTPSQSVLRKITTLFSSYKPVLSIDELTGMPSFSITVSNDQKEESLKHVLDYLKDSDKRIYVAIDEFQQIAEYPEKGIEALLRSYIQFLPNVNFIFAGSKQHLMQEMFTSSKRPFYQSTQLINIGSIDRETYADFAIGLFAQCSKILPRDVFYAIYEMYDGHTWYIQYLLNRLYGYNQDVDMVMVSDAMEQIVSEQSYSYQTLLKSYSAGQVRLLKAIAREGCVKEILAGDFISRNRLRAASSVSASLKRLQDNELVYLTPQGYIIYDRFMREWLRQQAF